MSQFHYIEPPPNWTAEERPTLPGSPATPYHRPAIRLAYAGVSVLVGITGGLGTALIAANLPQIQGQLGLTPVEGAWLQAAYVMVNVSSNLILVKFRQQFGVRRFAELGIAAYVLVTILHVMANDYSTALIARAVSGFAAAPLTSLGLYYMMQALPKRHVGAAICVGFAFTQFAVPLAWILSPPLLDIGDWRGLYLFELGMALLSMAAIVILKLPPGMRIRVFEPLDIVTFLFFAPAIALVAAVLAEGRTEWWPDQPWMAWALISALLLFLCAFFVEHHRARPLIQTRWLASAEILRFLFGALGLRLLLSEQTYAAAGLLRTLGMGPDQLQGFYAVVLLGTVGGAFLAAALFRPDRFIWLLVASVALIVVAGLMDQNATSLTRPSDLYVSQFIMAFASGLFIGPLVFLGIGVALSRGTDHVITLFVLFSITQSVGGLAGPALFGTFQQYREQEYSAQIVESVDPTDPVVAQRLQAQNQIYARFITDPVRRNAAGLQLLSQTATREANVRSFNDVVVLNTLMAVVLLVWSLIRAVIRTRAARHATRTAAKGAG
ncbi:MFS transporter [Aureimonas sp. Leaf454]|uniref:MFS transporter n=1 Tax=Aureimonas sp. Leaf454 TaxID=1736381 RepID=UPI0007009358|nr:MFS transporter [Aureimonas sp. Leaf454]KQT54560.1 MFS transporter [Aureimonas sp. Leaf454]